MKSIFLHVRKTKGNIFAMLFAAVGMTGVLGVVGMQTVSGPITTITKVTQKNIVDTDLMTNARIVILNAGIQVAGGDGDGDNYVEPAAYVPTSNPACDVSPSGGGCLPGDIGAIQTDPWGTPYGYCVWDHGLTTGSANRLQGKDSTSEPVIAIISAGRDKTFQTSCEPFDGSAPEGLQQVTTSDDSVRIYSYDAAVAGANGLWQLKSGDPTTAEIVKDLEIGDVGAGTGFAFDITTGEGTFPSVTTDVLTAYTGNNVEMAGGLRLDDEGSVTSCGAADSGVIRYNTTAEVIEVCNGAGDWDGADETALIDEDGDTRVQVEEGVDDDTIRFDTTGVERAVIEPDGDVAIDTDTLFVDAVNGRVGIGTTNVNANGKLHVRGGHIVLDSNGDTNVGFIMQGADNQGIGLSSNSFRFPNADLYVESNGDVWADTDTLFVDASTDRVGIGTTSPSNTLDVRSIQDDTARFHSTQHSWITGETSDATKSVNYVVKNPGQQWNIGMSSVNGSEDEDDFHITDVTDSSTPFLIEHATGDIGIGTTNPVYKLDIHIPGNAVRIKEGKILLEATGTATSVTKNRIGVTAGEDFSIGSGGSVSQFYIHNSGNVGVGTTNPDTLLDVDGPIEIGAGTCNATGHGRLQYTALNNIQYCNGSSWQTITGAVDSLDDIGDVNVTGVTTGQTIKWDGTNWVATNDLGTVSTGDTDILIDNDSDTKVQVEKNPDEDYIRFDTAGTERMHIGPNGRIGINQDFDTTDTEATVAIKASAATSTGVAIKTATNTSVGADLYMEAAGVIAADSSITMIVDGDNNSTAAEFKIAKNAKTSSAGDILKVREDGRLTLYGGYIELDSNKNNNWGFLTEAGLGGIGLTGSSARLAAPEFYVTDAGNVGINTTSAVAALEVGGTDAILFPRGIVGNRPAAPVNGMMRYNTATGKFEAYQGGAWQDILTSGAGNVAHSLADADNDTKIQVEEGADDDTIRFDTAGVERMVILPTGDVEVVRDIVAGRGGGGVAMTINDGYGNANLTFNHASGTPEQNGNAGRISVNTDATSGAYMTFELKDNVANGVATALNDVMYLRSDGRVGISDNDTDGTLTITGAPDISSANTAGQGGLVIQDVAGDASGFKMRFDANEIQTSNVGAPFNLALNPFGGGVSIGLGGNSTLNMTGAKIISVADPTANQDAATKKYVDDLVAGGTGDAGTLDSLDSTQFIRSDVNDDVTAHTEWQDNMEVRLGTGADFRMDFNGTDTTMRSYFASARWILQGADAGGTNRNMIIADPDGSVNLYYAGANKLNTRSNGIQVTGEIYGTGSFYYGDNKEIIDYADSWLRLNQNGDFTNGVYTPGLMRADGGFQVDSKTMISNNGSVHTAQFADNTRYGYFEGRRSDGSRGFYLGYGNGGTSVDLTLDAASNLSVNGGSIDMNNAKITELATPTAGTDAANKAYVDALVPANATNADTVDGLHAAAFIRSNANDDVSGHTEWQDNMSVRLGNAADFRMYHNGTHTYMDSVLHGAQWLLRGEDAGGTNRNMIVADPDNSVNLYYAGGIKARTTATGLRFQGVAGNAPTR